MLARDLITDGVLPLRTSDTGEEALSWMEESRVFHMPIVNERQFLGLVSELDLHELSDLTQALGSVPLSLHNAYVYDYQHLLEVLQVFDEFKLSLVPVIDENNNFLGTITLPNLVRQLAKITSVNSPGGIIILEMDQSSYSLAEISQIVEYNDAKVLSAFVSGNPDSTRLEVTIKVNKIGIDPILQTFSRYDYTILAHYAGKSDFDDLVERYDSLMNYLKI